MIFYAYFFCCLSQNNYLCTLIFSLLQNMQSHPTWVRGLKRIIFLESKTFYTLTIYPNTSKFKNQIILRLVVCTPALLMY